jgi:hypothetical protein
MLEIIIPERETYDYKINEFKTEKELKIKLEHSLLSISKWESMWCKPFLSNDKKSAKEIADYIRCMTLTQNVPDYVYRTLPNSELQKIEDYLGKKSTATIINSSRTTKHTPSNTFNKIITSEEIYYWMILYDIPFSCEKWNLNRLLTLIQICAIRQSNQQKMSKGDILRSNAMLNAKRKAKLGTHG